MPTAYEYVKFTTAGSTVKEKGIYLPACTDESGNFLPRRVATVDAVKTVATVYPLSSITIIKE